MKPSEVLEKAAELIEPEGAWTQGAYARGKRRPVDYWSTSATSFCVLGALFRAGGGGDAERYLWPVTTHGVGDWNDAPERTQSEVVSALRKAAELARSEGQ